MKVSVDKSKFGFPSLAKNNAVEKKPLAPIRVGNTDTDDTASSLRKIPVDMLDIDDCNIRTSANPKYADIKRSIASDKADGLLFHVTKSIDSDRYNVVNGTGTRLSILKELAVEFTGEGDNPFANATCRIVPDKGVAKRTLGSIKENYARGDNSYIEWAQAIMSLRLVYESEHDGKLSDAEFCRMISSEGVSLSKTELVRCRFASAQLMDSLPDTMVKGRKSTVFVRKVMEGRAASIGEAMSQLSKSRDFFSVPYDSAMSTMGTKLDGTNFDVEELLKKTERLFFKDCGVSKKEEAPRPPLDTVKKGSAESLDEQTKGAAEVGGTQVNTEKFHKDSSELTDDNVLDYLIALNNERFLSLLEEAKSRRS